MSIYNIDGYPLTADLSKEVWVDNYNSIEDAIADGDIINFTEGKTYEIDHGIVIDKACYLKGNGCIFHADPVEPSETTRPYYYMFNVEHDNVIIENFNAYSEDLYPWQNALIIYPDTITSNVYFLLISASNVYVEHIKTDHLCGAVRIANDADAEAFSYHDVSFNDITCLNGVINVYIGNVVRCTATNLMLTTNVHNDTLGHAVYISRGTKHVSVSNFTIYNNYGMYGGISIHPSSSDDETLTTNIVVANGTVRSISDGSYGVQITCVKDILISNVKFESINGAKSVSISQKAMNITFTACDFDGSDGVIRCAVHGDQQNIVFNGCNIRCYITATGQSVMTAIQGMTFIGCHFLLLKDTDATEPNAFLFSSNPIDTAVEHGIDIADCLIEVTDDIKMRMLQENTSVASVAELSNIVVVSAASVGFLFDSGATYASTYYLHNIIAKNYTYIFDITSSSNKIIIDDMSFARCAVEFSLPTNTTKNGRIIGKYPNIIVLQNSSGTVAVAVVLYSSSVVSYIGNSMNGITITKSANSNLFSIANTSGNAVYVSVK